MRNLLICSLLVSLFACSGESEEQEDPVDHFVSETTIVDTLYPPLETVCMDIMDKLQICTLSDTVLDRPPCSNQFFRVFDHKPEKDWKSGFIVEMIPGLYGSPVHQVVIIEDYMGKYTIVNQYLGHLMELRTQYSGYSDLLIGYDDPDVGLVAIRHSWQGNKYEPVDVEEINNHFIKPEFKDSINNIFLPAFSAGH